MKYIPTILIAVACAMAPVPLLAGSKEDELLQLREIRDKAVTVASAPINGLYATSLQELLQRVTADGNKQLAATIQYELQLLGRAPAAATTTATEPAQAAKRVDSDPAKLRSRLTETKWRLSGDKTFILHGDGTTTGDWTQRKGDWKVTGPNTLELSIWNVPRTEAVTIDEGASMITWVDKDEDQAYPNVAKKIASLAPAIAGEWMRSGDRFRFSEDGTWTRSDVKGTWSWIDTKMGLLEMRWESNPKWVDSYIVSANVQHLHGHNLDRTIFFTMERVK